MNGDTRQVGSALRSFPPLIVCHSDNFPFFILVLFVYFKTEVNSPTVFNRIGHSWHVHFSSFQLLLNEVFPIQAPYATLQFIERQKKGKTARKRPLGIFTPCVEITVDVYQVLN